MQLDLSNSASFAMTPRPTWTRFCATLALGAGSLLGAIQLAAQPAHLNRGHQLVDEIVAAQSQGVFTGVVDGATVFLNRYGGSWNSNLNPSFIRFFDANRAANVGPYAANLTECAPLVTHLLRNTYGWDWHQHFISDPMNNGNLVAKSSPSSYLYVSAIKHQVGFASQVTNFLDVLPGDIGARWEVGTSTGHTLIVVGVNLDSAKAYPVSSADISFVPELAGSTYYELTVLDSSATGHSGGNDTRLITYNGSTALSGGAGRGVMGVFANANGQVIGHTWSLPTSSYLKTKNGVTGVNPTWLSSIKSRLERQADIELVFGRLPALAPVVP